MIIDEFKAEYLENLYVTAPLFKQGQEDEFNQMIKLCYHSFEAMLENDTPAIHVLRHPAWAMTLDAFNLRKNAPLSLVKHCMAA